jgi:PBP1b-binding outer membrane lipoprotein LpoB
MKLHNTLILVALVFTSCSCETKTRNGKKKQQITKTELPLRTDAVPKKKVQLIERTELKQKIEKKYGEQWDFCACILKNDSINKAFKNKLTPEQEDKLIDRWDFVETKCKELTTFDNTTPEERAIYQARVKKCLKNKL